MIKVTIEIESKNLFQEQDFYHWLQSTISCRACREKVKVVISRE